jgi:hypothetical protein
MQIESSPDNYYYHKSTHQYQQLIAKEHDPANDNKNQKNDKSIAPDSKTQLPDNIPGSQNSNRKEDSNQKISYDVGVFSGLFRNPEYYPYTNKWPTDTASSSTTIFCEPVLNEMQTCNSNVGPNKNHMDIVMYYDAHRKINSISTEKIGSKVESYV